MDANLLPDISRADCTIVLASQTLATPAGQPHALETLNRWWQSRSWPANLLSLNSYASLDGESVLTYSQWKHDVEIDEGLQPGAFRYRLYRSRILSPATDAGCIVVNAVEFDGADEERQRLWIDLVCDAIAADTPFRGAISGHFHISVDGRSALNYSEWTDETSHRAASEQLGPQWRRVMEFPGVKSRASKRYGLYKSLHPPFATSAA